MPKEQWLQKCQVHSVGTGYPSLSTICTHFTDKHGSMTLGHAHSIHWSQSNGNFLLPFSASSCESPCLHPLGGFDLTLAFRRLSAQTLVVKVCFLQFTLDLDKGRSLTSIFSIELCHLVPRLCLVGTLLVILWVFTINFAT